MIDSLALHGIQAKDLVPALMTTHTVANPEYDPAEARKQAEIREREAVEQADHDSEDVSEHPESSPSTPTTGALILPEPAPKPVQTTAKVLEDSAPVSIPGVSTHLSNTDENVTLDIRWTVLCDLFLILVADSVYDARSRVLLESVALKLGLGWVDVVKFERRVTEALDIQEEVDSLEASEKVEEVKKKSKKRRYMMMGLATLGTSHFCLNITEPNTVRRWWPRYWTVCRPARPSHRCRTGRSIRNCRYHWDNWILSRRWGCGCNHDRRRLDRIEYRCTGHGTPNSIR